MRSNAGHSTSCRHGTETNRNAPRDRLHGRLDIAVYRAALEGGWPGCRPEKLNATRRQVGRLRRSLPGGRRWSIDRLGRQRLRQFDAREFFHHPRIRADRSAPLPISERGAHGRFSLHRRLLESPHAATQPALSFADQMRKETQWPQRDRLRPNPCITVRYSAEEVFLGVLGISLLVLAWALHDDRSLATREFFLPAMICSRAGPSDICGCVPALDAFIAPPRCSDRTSWLT